MILLLHSFIRGLSKCAQFAHKFPYVFLLHGNLLIDSLLIRLLRRQQYIFCLKKRVCTAFISLEGHQLHAFASLGSDACFRCVFYRWCDSSANGSGKARKIGNAQRHYQPMRKKWLGWSGMKQHKLNAKSLGRAWKRQLVLICEKEKNFSINLVLNQLFKRSLKHLLGLKMRETKTQTHKYSKCCNSIRKKTHTNIRRANIEIIIWNSKVWNWNLASTAFVQHRLKSLRGSELLIERYRIKWISTLINVKFMCWNRIQLKTPDLVN